MAAIMVTVLLQSHLLRSSWTREMSLTHWWLPLPLVGQSLRFVSQCLLRYLVKDRCVIDSLCTSVSDNVCRLLVVKHTLTCYMPKYGGGKTWQTKENCIMLRSVSMRLIWSVNTYVWIPTTMWERRLKVGDALSGFYVLAMADGLVSV